MKTDKQTDNALYLTGWILIAVAITYELFVTATGIHFLKYLPPCAFHWLTGYYCPGCGGTRAVIAFFHGQIGKSIYYHPFVPYVLFLGGWFMISQTIERLTKEKCKIGMHFRFAYLWVGLIILILNCIIKNAVLFIEGTALL